jgi:hypothetical protein
MAVRSFAGNAALHLLPGAAVGKTITTATVAVLWKRNQTTLAPVLGLGPPAAADTAWTTTSSNFNNGMVQAVVEATATNRPYTVFNNSGVASPPASTPTIVNADGWVILVTTKATGAVAPRYHVRYLTAATTTRNDAGSTQPNVGRAIVSTDRFQFGKDEFNNKLNGSVALAGFWDIAMSDAQVDALWTNLRTSDWSGHAAGAPFALWEFSQDSVATAVTDLMGGGADQTAILNTAVVTGDDPPGWTFAASAPSVPYIPHRMPLGA